MTDGEFTALKALFHSGVRVFTLVPVSAVAMALATYGSTPASEALITALGLARPNEWPAMAAAAGVESEASGEESEEEEGKEAGEEEAESEDDEEQDDESDDEEGADEESGSESDCRPEVWGCI